MTNGEGPVWKEALDWLLKVEAAPGDETLRAGLSAWLAASEEHADAYRRAEKVWRLTGDAPALHADRWRVQERPMPAAVRRRIGSGVATAALAACLLLLVGFFFEPLRTALMADYSTSTAETREIVLADGTSVYLNAQSAIAVTLEPSRRDVTLLRGEAYFVVAPDKRRPFSVTAAGMTARDIGTIFDVALDAAEVSVAVRTGAVQVTYGAGRSLSVDSPLTPGHRLRIERSTASSHLDRLDEAQMGAWRTGKLIVHDEPVGQVVDALRPYFRGYILLRDSALADAKVSGVYDLHDPAAALQAVVQPHLGAVRVITPYLLIVSGR